MSNKITLVVMAAGLGSRYNDGLKQLAEIGPNGESLMDYSINDAIEAGFNKIIFIIRHEIEKEFKEKIGKRISKLIEVSYAYQEIENIPIKINIERQKLWGTVHAILSCKNLINEPFCVINADDFYGKKAFNQVYKFLTSNTSENEFCMAGYILGNTMSENGGVNRGICTINDNGYLIDVIEVKEIVRQGNKAIGIYQGQSLKLDLDSYVSMNLWGFKPSVLSFFEENFVSFLQNLSIDKEKSECLIPTVIDKLIKDKKIQVKLLETNDKWFGITYLSDKKIVEKEIKNLIDRGYYN